MRTYPFQKAGKKRTNTVNISSRPISIPILNIHLAASGKVEKLPVGPTICPIPGPTLATAVTALVMLVIGSSPKLPNNAEITMMVKKK